MRKKHYDAIAEEISFAIHRGKFGPEIIAHRLADYFATDNANFDRDRFLQACGIPCDDCGYTKCPAQRGGECTPT